MATKKFPNAPQHPERVCWGCDKFCSAKDMRCGNGSDRTPHPVELFGEDWAEWGAAETPLGALPMGTAATPVPATVLAVCTGAAVPFARGSRSGIHKTPVQGHVRVTTLGLHGDAQGDLRVHGGVEKAVHHYPQEHYAAWRAELGAPALLDAPGAFGENLHSQGMTEATVCLGDHWRVGDALLEVTQARQPCWKLNVRFGLPDMARRVQQTHRTGWYYRVLQEGDLWAGAALELQARPYPEWTLERLLDLLYRPVLDSVLLHAALALPLPASWQRLLQRRLDTGVVEDWAPRLDGPPATSVMPA